MLKIKIDSRKVEKGDTFVAIKGANVNGHDFIEKAIANGASKVIISEDRQVPVEKVLVEDTKEYLKEYLVKTYAEEINKIHLIGVTGTNGKTTSCFLIYQLLQKLGKKVAYIGTIGYYFENEKVELPNTTPDILDLYDMILSAKSKGCDYVVMEVSSHALDYQRVAGLKYDVVAFTNLTQDHLDYHKTMENYLHAKLKILNHLKDNAVVVVNVDDEYGHYFAKGNYKSISFTKGDYKVVSYHDNVATTYVKFKFLNKEYEVDINLKNRFNIYNYLTALASVHNLGFNLDDIIKATKEIKAPKGRCEMVKVKEGLVVVDYAHTPDAVLKIITSFAEHKKGDIITIVGCGGDRDPKKRPIMGDIATKYSDYVIFTDDNPRTEDNKKIMQDILDGVTKDNYEVIYNRRQAIEKGISLIKKDTILLVLGKGHEDYQILGKEKVHFDDMEVILECAK